MPVFYADLHIHIGRTSTAHRVKITASSSLTMENILKEAFKRKGLNIIGIVDCNAPGVQWDIQQLIKNNILQKTPHGGLSYASIGLVILASELEVKMGRGRVHLLSYFSNLESMSQFSQEISRYVTNINLSSQQVRLSGDQLLEITLKYGGFLIPAHAFTPHRGMYGACVSTIKEAFPQGINHIFGLELGLSADSHMADHIPELKRLSFLTNSDAHSLPKIAREYTTFQLKELSFQCLQEALEFTPDNHIMANYGMDPRLGKYYRSFCPNCGTHPQIILSCPFCCGEVVVGVLDRIKEIGKDHEPVNNRPPCIKQVPLGFLPGFGPKTLDKLLDVFGTEMAVLHQVSKQDLIKVIGEALTQSIWKSRTGQLHIQPGGGGHYGKILS